MSLVNLSHVCSHLQNASLARLGLTSIPYTRLHLSLALLLQKQGFFSTVKLAGPSPPASSLPPGLQEGILPKYPRSLKRRGGFEKDRESALSRLINARQRTEGAGMTGIIETLQSEGYREEDITWATHYAQKSDLELQEEGVPVEAMGLTIENQPFTLRPSRTGDPDDLESEGIVTQANRASRRLWLGLKYWDGLPVLTKARMLSKPTKRIWLNSNDFANLVRGRSAGEVRGMTRVGEVVAVSTDRGVLEARECVERKVGGMVLCRVY